MKIENLLAELNVEIKRTLRSILEYVDVEFDVNNAALITEISLPLATKLSAPLVLILRNG